MQGKHSNLSILDIKHLKLHIMKHFSPMLIALFIHIGLSAQITLTQTNSIPNVGDSFDFKITFDTSLVVSSGQNQIWDFSGVTNVNYQVQTYKYYAPAQAKNQTDFPNSTIIKADYNVPSNGGPKALFQEHHLKVNATDYSILGHYSEQAFNYIYSNDWNHLRYPLSYGDTYTDSMKCDQYDKNGSNWDKNHKRIGTVQIDAVGTGKLLTPAATFDSTLLVRKVTEYDYYFGSQSMVTRVYHDTAYFWYAKGIKQYVATVTSSCDAFPHDRNNCSTQHSPSFRFATTITPGGSSTIAESAPVKAPAIYPNPTTDEVSIANLDQYTSIAIISPTGAIVHTMEIQHPSEKINVSDFPNGVYIVMLKGNQQTHYTKLVVQ